MTQVDKKASELAAEYSKDLWKFGNGNTAYFAFIAGFKAGLEMPELKALVEASEKYLNCAPVDGWHFSDCDASEDNYEDEMPCSCGVGTKEISLKEKLSDWRSFIGGEG